MTTLPATGTDNLSQWSSGQKSNPSNETKAYINDGIVGFDETKRTTFPVYRPGTIMHGEGDEWWIYGKASADIAAATRGVLTVSGANYTVAGGSGTVTTVSAFKNGQYGWFKSFAKILTG